MDRRQGTAGRKGSGDRLSRPAIVVFHDLDGARAALAAAAASSCPLILLTAPGAAQYGGPAFWLEIVRQACREHPGVEVSAILDCAGDPAMVHAALGLGWRRVIFTGTEAMRAKLHTIAAQTGSEVLAEPPPAEDLNQE